MDNQNNLTPVFGDGVESVLDKLLGKALAWAPYIITFLAIIATVIAGYNCFRLLTKEGRQEMAKVVRDIVISVIIAGLLWLGFAYFRNLANNEASSDFGDLEGGSGK